MRFLYKRLSDSVSNKFQFRPEVISILNNISWLVFDKTLRLGAGLFLGIFIARYLGPAGYGLLNYAIAFSSLAGSFVSLGLDSIVIKELVRRPEDRDRILGSAFFMKLFAGVLGLVVNIALISIIKPGDTFILYLVALSSFGFIFQAIGVIDFYYQSRVKSKYSVFAQNGAFLTVVILRIILLVNKAPVMAFAIAGVIESFLIAAFVIFTYKKFSNLSITTWQFDKFIAIQLIKESYPLIFAGLASMINMRLDQVMLGSMLDEKTVGIYTVAIRIAEIWYVIPMFLSMSIYPSIISAKEQSYALYRSRLHKIVFYMSCFAVPFALFITFSSDFIVNWLYGTEFLQAGTILSIYIWAGLPYVAAFAYSQAFYIEKLTNITFITTVYTVLANLILNYFLIPKFGPVGAAISTLIAAISAFILSIYLLKKHTQIFTFTLL
jgi:O-antigen/teichoic acid export membrane protein